MHWNQTNQLLVKEHVGLLKAANNYDVFNLEGGEQILSCREPNLKTFTKVMRFTDAKRMTPFHIEIRDSNNQPVVKIDRGWTFLASKIQVTDAGKNNIGYIQQNLFSVGGSFKVFDPSDRELFKVKGKWTSWEFNFKQGDRDLASVSKKWAGIGKELFTSADNYALQISDDVPDDSNERKLILAVVFCIDMIMKE